MIRRLALGFVCALAGCYDPPVASPPTTVTQETPIRVPQNKQNKVDVLFLVDNSRSMEPMSRELAAKFPTFFQAFEAAAAKGNFADLHIGVVTSDYGAGAGGGSSGCDPFGGGQSGKLQALGAGHDAGCLAPVGAPFIKYSFEAAATGPSNNLPAGQDLGKTFACMAQVGAAGCGFEHQLEAVYAALHNNVENKDFLRPEARLAVVFVTNEDDGSAAPDSAIYDLSSTALGPKSTYRQTMYAVECGNPEMLTPNNSSNGALHGCLPAPNPSGDRNRAFDVQRYVDFFSRTRANGGVKIVPEDTILVGIDALYDDAQGLSIILATPPVAGAVTYSPCASLDESSVTPCEPFLQHSCQNAARPEFFGDPAVRINSVIGKAKNNKLLSICDDDYTPAMKAIADLIIGTVPAGCVPAPLADLAKPDCVVEDWITNGDGTLTEQGIPRCDEAPAGATCWRVEMKPECAPGGGAAETSPQGVGVTVDRMRQEPAAGTVARVSCNTVVQ